MIDAYVAGVFDMSGKFVFVNGRPKIYILSKNKEFLDYLRDLLGIGRVFPKGNIFIFFIQSYDEIIQLVSRIEPFIYNQKATLQEFKHGLLGNELSKDLLDSPPIF